ncbi:hypothetical protein ACFTAO_03210 [Paenibacillus rhizoplanae]
MCKSLNLRSSAMYYRLLHQQIILEQPHEVSSRGRVLRLLGKQLGH